MANIIYHRPSYTLNTHNMFGVIALKAQYKVTKIETIRMLMKI